MSKNNLKKNNYKKIVKNKMETSTNLKELLENQNFYEDNNDYLENHQFNEEEKIIDDRNNIESENNNENNSVNDIDNVNENDNINYMKNNNNSNNYYEDDDEDEYEGEKYIQINNEKQNNLEPQSQPFFEKPKQQITVLEEKGYVFLKSVFKSEVIDRLCFEVNQFMQMEGIYSHLQKRQDVALQRYYVNNTYGSLTNFQQIQHYFVPVIDNRGTYNRITDVGVVDIYNADKLFAQIRSYFDINLMLVLLNKLSNIEWKLTRVNLQIHSNVQNPMSFHFDGGNEKNIKFTIYLTDILDEYSGPPVFMEGTHKNKKQIKPSQAKILTGNRGDVLISYQNGFHRKLVQKVQSTNMYLTFHFTTKYEKDRYFPLNF